MKYVYFLIISFSLFSCKEQTKIEKLTAKQEIPKQIDKSVIDTLSLGLNFTPTKDYNITKQEINIQRLQFQKEFKTANNKQEKELILHKTRKYFTDKLLNDITPHWYGTVWDFNGYTNTPNDGVVACGYFVSTTLKHMGLNINRYKLAQQAGLNEAKSLQPNKKILTYHITETNTFDIVYTKMKKQLKDGLYFVGLSNHVGYIYVKNNELYFLNSDYANGYVTIEKANYSNVFRSNIYVIADITHNDFLMRSWINNSKIPVKKD